MSSCFGCGAPAWEFEIVNMYRVLSTHEEDNLFSTTETTNYETTSLQVPYCTICKRRMNIFKFLLVLVGWLSIGSVYYLWHLYLPNFFAIKGFFLPLGVIIAYFVVIGTIFFICEKIISLITGHRKSPSDHPEFKKMISDGWKEGNR